MTVAATGALSPGFDRGANWKSLQCGLDALSLGAGVGGIVGDVMDAGRVVGAGADFLSDSYTWESVGATWLEGRRRSGSGGSIAAGAPYQGQMGEDGGILGGSSGSTSSGRSWNGYDDHGVAC